MNFEMLINRLLPVMIVLLTKRSSSSRSKSRVYSAGPYASLHLAPGASTPPLIFLQAGCPSCLERDADLHTAQLMPLPLTVSCFKKIQIGFTFLVPAHLGSPGERAVKRVCVCVCVCVGLNTRAPMDLVTAECSRQLVQNR